MGLHKDLTGADLHEPKGVASATSGQVYIANGSGSGAWTTLTIPSQNFVVNTAEFTSSGTWTKPANLIGIKIHLIGGGGGGYVTSTPGGAGGTSAALGVVSLGGGTGGTAGSGRAASGTWTRNAHSLFGGSGRGPEAVLSSTAYGYGSDGDGTGKSGGHGAYGCWWYGADEVTSGSITIGAAGFVGPGGEASTAGYCLIEQYIRV